MRSMSLMGKAVGLVAAALLLSACASPAAPAATEVPTSQDEPYSQETIEAIEAATEGAMSTAGIPGAIIVMQTPEGRFEQAFGVGDEATAAPIEMTDHMRIGSITKSMTVTLVLELADDGKLDLDAPARTYLPELPEKWDAVTVRQLANMTSGVPSYSNTMEFYTELVENPQRTFTPTDLIAFVQDRELLFPPGSAFDYSNSNTIILGMLVEQVTGDPYAENMQALFDRAELAETSYAETAAEFPTPHPEGYTTLTPDGSQAVATDWNASWAGAAGAGSSTARDLEVWLGLVVSGSLISDDLQRERLDLVPMPGNPDGAGYGLGIAETNGWLGHSGDLPGYSSTMYARADGSMLIVLTSTNILAPRADGTPIAPSAFIAEAISAVVLPDAPFIFPHVDSRVP